jgi:hypothetical protein
MNALISAEGITNYKNAASSSLAFSASGYHNGSNGTVLNEGSFGYYGTSSVNGVYLRNRFFNSSGTGVVSYYRAGGFWSALPKKNKDSLILD